MSDLVITITVALIGLVGAIMGAYFTVRAQVRLVQKDNALLYLWNRQLVDHIYKGQGPPAPSPPDGLFKQ